jgi:heat shock protein HslJ
MRVEVAVLNERRRGMKTKTILVILALASVGVTCASSSSAPAYAEPQNSAPTFVEAQKSGGGNPLSGTSWQLVKFYGPDDSTVAPDDKSKYTIRFASDGRVLVRVDCNRGHSTWRATATGELQFGSWSRTTAKCGPGSLHDRIVTEGGMVRNFTIKDGRLFLSGRAGGGYYELEPIPGRKR